ncbi:MAG: hypothetical protein QG671_262 [Actinomycetota bacterium]|nr:hypothetical protein [Actinomycetota bacterium]
MTVAGTGSVVEAELVGGRLSCPGCAGRLGGWGHARARRVRVLGGWCWIRPRRVRCVGCGGTHVLLPVLCLLRRMYSAEIIWSALVAKAVSGAGWRRIGEGLDVPGTTVRGWLRRFAGRAEQVRVFFTRAGLEVGIDLPGVAATGSVYGDAVAASGLLVAAVRQRFTGSGPDDGLPPLWQVACAVSGGRLLFPGWPRP